VRLPRFYHFHDERETSNNGNARDNPISNSRVDGGPMSFITDPDGK
jgi:hypothetical protein